jgi:hypothetical protein
MKLSFSLHGHDTLNLYDLTYKGKPEQCIYF